MTHNDYNNDALRERALKALDYRIVGTIVFCAARGWSETRNFSAIKATCEEFCIEPAPVLAAFGWLPSLVKVGEYADVLNDPRAVGIIDECDSAMVAAWALCRLAAGRHGLGRVCLKRDKVREAAEYTTRLLRCIRANRARRGPIEESIRLTKRASQLSERISDLSLERSK